ncbi:hypothetical protein F53441_9720 [Fusarium austroafricanum]|uniref:Protein kinase domain-containing protein n=1 Tax=Fusarium austroafricanum TaxID=2364996 RepID=A0A8H4KBX8_9HYPO|nr:hypothetical protein F53441_9720 [Fusarium austroafricanum]
MVGNQVEFQVGVAGLGIGAFGGLLDAFTACSKLYGLWKALSGLEGYIGVLRTKLILQEALLDQWQRDWLDLPTSKRSDLQKQRILRRHQDAVLASMLTVKSLLETLEPLREASRSEHALERLKLAAGGASDHDKTLVQISEILNDLYRLLPTRDPNVALSQTVLSLEHIDNTTQFLLEDNSSTQHVLGPETLKKAIKFRRLGRDLDQDLEERILNFRHSTGISDVGIPAHRVQVTKDDEVAGGLRSYGNLDAKTPVLIEWKRYDLTWKGQNGIRLRGRIENIARLLHAESKPDELLTLNCLGVFEDMERRRYGLVFGYPNGVGEHKGMLSLHSLIKLPTPETLPTLGDRYRMAHAIALSLAILHASGWLHKSIRSHNIMIPMVGNRPAWSRPCLVGFDFSRPDAIDETTEKPEQSVRFNLYRHPSAQGIPGESYRKGFDIYSLGVVLVEVGLWRLAWNLRRDDENPAKFKDVLISRVDDMLAHFMGTQYQEAVRSSLNGDLDQRGGSVIRVFYNEVVETMCSLAESQP